MKPWPQAGCFEGRYGARSGGLDGLVRTVLLSVSVFAWFVMPALAQTSAQPADTPSFADPRPLPGQLEQERRARQAAEARAAAEAEARRTAEEERKRRLEAERAAEAARKQVEAAEAARREAEKKRAEALAEAQRQAEEARRLEAERARLEREAREREAAQRAKAEEDARVRAAEERRKLEEQRRLAEEERREREARLRAEREARERADERRAALERAREAEAERQAEAERRAAAERSAAVAPKASTVEQTRGSVTEDGRAAGGFAALETGSPNDPATSCPPSRSARIETTPLPAGRMTIDIASTCRAGQPVAIRYGTHEFVRALSSEGNLQYTLDLFLGDDAPLEVRFQDNVRQTLQIYAQGLDKISKIAITWSAPVDLDLHALEYASGLDDPGHVWSAKPRSMEAARIAVDDTQQGHGFLSTATTGDAASENVEVYTFLHREGQRSGTVSLVVDYAERGDVPSGETCGSGRYAAVDFQMHRLSKGKRKRTRQHAFAPAQCGVALAHEERFNRYGIKDFRVR